METFLIFATMIGLPLLAILIIKIIIYFSNLTTKKEIYLKYIQKVEQRRNAIAKDILENKSRLTIEYEFYSSDYWNCTLKEFTIDKYNEYLELEKKISAEWHTGIK